MTVLDVALARSRLALRPLTAVLAVVALGWMVFIVALGLPRD